MFVTFQAYWFSMPFNPLFLSPMAFFASHGVPLFKIVFGGIKQMFDNTCKQYSKHRINTKIYKIFHVRVPFFSYQSKGTLTPQQRESMDKIKI